MIPQNVSPLIFGFQLWSILFIYITNQIKREVNRIHVGVCRWNKRLNTKTFSCHVRTDVNWRQVDVRPHVTWRSWQRCRNYNSLVWFSSNFVHLPPRKSLTPLMSRTPHKQDSNVILSIQFDTNVSQLIRHVLPWSYDPLPSLGDRLSVCLSCLLRLWIPPVVYSRHIMCLHCLRVALFFHFF